MNTTTNHSSLQKTIRIVDIALSVMSIIFIFPVYILNASLSVILSRPVFIHKTQFDLLGRPCITRSWNSGIMHSSAILLDILFGHLSFCGVSITKSKLPPRPCARTHLPSSLFSVYCNHTSGGISELTVPQSLIKHEKKNSVLFHVVILVRGVFNRFFYDSKNLRYISKFKIFDIPINNVTMKEATDWIVDSERNENCKVAYFINTNSINLAYCNPQLVGILNKADRSFADGSGVRIAAKQRGIKLKENVNGTDMLPGLCRAVANKDKSLFLLGSAPGIAEKTARKIQALYPRVKIAGTHHGYFDMDNSEEVINKINQSGANICLVGLGSPNQEKWLNEHKSSLKVDTAVAVGGLFDFYSGRIPRAPLWLRELGLEWIFRLMKEPRAKFYRYVIGNPIFMWRVFILNKG